MTIEWLLPGKAQRNNSDFPATPRALRQWLESADRLEQRELSHRILEAVRALNGLDLAPRERLRLLEILRPSARKALDYLGGRVHAQPLPLPAPARAAFEIDLELLGELTRGYEATLTHQAWHSQRRTVALATERALALMGERVLRIAQTYVPLDPAFWRGAKDLLRRAEEAGADQYAVVDEQLRFAPRRRQSPATMFKRIVLFSLAGTQGFRRGEARRLYRALETWALLVPMQRLASAQPSAHTRFAIDLDAEGPPRLLEAGPAAGRGVRLLDVGELVHRVEQLRIEIGPEQSPIPTENELGAPALTRLINSWHPANYQRGERAHRGTEVDAEITLNVIHTRIMLETTPVKTHEVALAATDEWSVEPIDEAPGGGTPRIDGVRPGINWNEVSRGRDRSAGYEAARDAEARSVRVGAEREDAQRWLLEDVSDTGFRLVWAGDGSCRAAVGELVALRLSLEEGRQRRWCVGVIRRMQFMDEARFEIGVEVLSRHPVPVRIRTEPSNPNMTRFRDSESTAPALMLPAGRKDRQHTTVIVPAHMFHGEEIVEIDVQDRMLRLKLGEVHEDTGAFTRYRLASAPERGRHAPSDTRFAGSL